MLIKIDRLRIVTTRGRKDRLYLQWSGRVRFLLAFHCKHKNLTVGTCCKLLRSKNINFKIIFSRHCKVLFNSTADIFKKVIFFFQSLSYILSSFIDIFNLSFFLSLFIFFIFFIPMCEMQNSLKNQATKW